MSQPCTGEMIARDLQMRSAILSRNCAHGCLGSARTFAPRFATLRDLNSCKSLVFSAIAHAWHGGCGGRTTSTISWSSNAIDFGCRRVGNCLYAVLALAGIHDDFFMFLVQTSKTVLSICTCYLYSFSPSATYAAFPPHAWILESYYYWCVDDHLWKAVKFPKLAPLHVRRMKVHRSPSVN